MDKKLLKEAAIIHKNLILSPYDKIIDINDGFDVICELTNEFGGSSLYIPNLRTIFKQCIEQEICNRYNGKNIRKLVKEYGFSERHIRKLI